MPITAHLKTKSQAEIRHTVTTAIRTQPKKEQQKRVAIYCRISSLDGQTDSIVAQREHFLHMANADPSVTLVDVYYEDGISGTEAENRPEFQRLLGDCRAGKVDEIWCKSISRWARNLENLLESVTELRKLGVELYFEKESLRILSGAGDLMVNLYGSFSEYESKSIKLNTKMGYRSRMMRGEYFYKRPPYGYDANETGQLVANETEAAVVRRIFQMCLDGLGGHRIAKQLKTEGLPTKRGAPWQPTTIRAILSNITYTGDVILQKTIRVSNGPRKKNDGREDQFYVSDHHEPIITHEVFEAAQKAMSSRARGRKKGDGKSVNRYAFSSKLICAHCGHHLQRMNSSYEIKWQCAGRKARGCPLKRVSDLEVKAVFKRVVVDIDRLLEMHSSMTRDDVPALQLQENLSRQEAVKALQPVLTAAELTHRLNTLRQEEQALRQQISNDTTDALKKACHKVKPNGKWAEFEPVFTDHVESVKIWQDGRMEFQFKCGVSIVGESD